MDALAGYGSESSSSGSGPTKKSSLIGLLGSSVSGASDDEELKNPNYPVKKNHDTKYVGEKAVTQQMIMMIPSAPTSSTCGSSILHLETDYLSPMLKSLCHDEMTQSSRPTCDSFSDQTLMQNARSETSYYNPRFFRSMVDRFGINVPLQSRAQNFSCQKDYEQQLFQKAHNSN